MCNRGCAKPNEPGVVVERPQGWDYQADPGEAAADERGDDGAPVPAAAVGVCAVAAIEVAEFQTFLTHQPIVCNQDSADRSETAGITNQPGKNITRRIGEQTPWLHQYADDAGDQSAGAK